jgi:hypothetical protein
MRDVSNRVSGGDFGEWPRTGRQTAIRHVSVELLAILADVATIVLRRCTLRPFISFFIFSRVGKAGEIGNARGGTILVSALFSASMKIRGMYKPTELLAVRNQIRAARARRVRHALRGPGIDPSASPRKPASDQCLIVKTRKLDPTLDKAPKIPRSGVFMPETQRRPRQQTCEHRYGTPANFFSTPNRSGKRSGDIQSNSVSRAVADRTEADAAIPG